MARFEDDDEDEYEAPGELALTQPRIQVGNRSVDQEQNEDPDLDSGKPVPGKMIRDTMRLKLTAKKSVGGRSS